MLGGYLLINKAEGFTSFDALRPIKRLLKSGKVGHTGTLDKFASGLLVVLTEKALKLSNYFMHCDKSYIGTIKLGVETDTLDPEGSIVRTAPVPQKDDLLAALPFYSGGIMQEPPAYSALHINGKRASALAREGKNIEMIPRPVTIHSLELLDFSPPFAKIAVSCSSGTYIRSLARDIAAKSGSAGHLVQLERTKIGNFSSCDALPQADICEQTLKKALIPIETPVFEKLSIPTISIDAKTASLMRHGKTPDAILSKDTISVLYAEKSQSAAFFCENDFVAIIENRCQKLCYGFVNANN
ncbi:MAG: tRNA pseudouridine(55) synthase TruB [Spirochaetaceae bacterium]|jgi:tRNA pseudouridine55 synthase|nr:tRNA pseudouridine(55) synthase TruB [Spirochaetaceae bacterium]